MIELLLMLVTLYVMVGGVILWMVYDGWKREDMLVKSVGADGAEPPPGGWFVMVLFVVFAWPAVLWDASRR